MNNKKRIFISIPLLNNTKEELISFKEDYKDLPIKWVSDNNLHITLFFIGYLNKDKIALITEDLKNLLLNYKKFLIELTNIEYYPKGKKNANYIWVIIKKSKELIELNKKIKDILLKNNIILLEEKNFLPHITLGKIKRTIWKTIDLEELPEINEELNLNFKINKIEILESKANNKGAKYITLKEIRL